MIAADLQYTDQETAPVKVIKAYLTKLLKALESQKTHTLLCCDPNYFKVLTGLKKTMGALGYIHPCKIDGYTHMSVILCPNHQSLFHDPTNQTKIDLALDTLANHIQGTHVDLGTNIIHKEIYPKTDIEIEHWLTALLEHPVLTCDIETEGLFFTDRIATISFAWDSHNGIAFPIDYRPFIVPLSENNKLIYGKFFDNKSVKKLLKTFFELYKGKLVYHNGTFDMKLLIYHLWMCKL